LARFREYEGPVVGDDSEYSDRSADASTAGVAAGAGALPFRPDWAKMRPDKKSTRKTAVIKYLIGITVLRIVDD